MIGTSPDKFFSELGPDPREPEAKHFGVSTRKPFGDRLPDVAHRRYVPRTRDGTLVFRTQFIKNSLEPPCDTIRKLLTEIEFEADLNEPTMHVVELKLQQIESVIDNIRLTIRDVKRDS